MTALTSSFIALLDAGVVADTVVKASVLLLLTWLATLALRRYSAATRHAIWTVGLACIALLPFARTALPAWDVPGVEVPAGDVVPLPAMPPVAARGRVDAAAVRDAPRVGRAQSMALVYHVMARDVEETRRPAVPVAKWLWGLWMLGWLVLLAWLALDIARIAWITRRARAAPADVTALGERLARQLAIGRRVRFRVSEHIGVPVTWGLVTPAVVLPGEAAAWPSERMRVVLLHELAHVRRGDYACHLLAELVCAMHWMNPLVWLAARRARAEQERACDDAVLRVGPGSAEYAEHLLAIARAFVAEGPATRGALALARPSSLVGRVRSILQRDSNRAPAARRPVALVATLAAVVGAPLASAAVGRDRATARAIEHLGATAVTVRRDAAFELGARGANVAVPHLIQALGDPSPAVRGVAATALGRIGDRQAVAPLLPLSKDSDPYVREMALLALGHWPDDPHVIETLVRALKVERVASVRSVAVAVVDDVPGDAAGRVLAYVAHTDRDAHTRAMAIWALATSGAEYAGPEIAKLLADPDPAIRAEAAGDLRETADPRVAPALVRALRTDSAADVRLYAVAGLAGQEADVAARGIRWALTDPEPHVRRYAAKALGELGGAVAVEALLDALRDSDHQVRLLAAHALDRLRPTDAGR